MTRRRRGAGLVAATLVAAAGLVGLGAGPASAAQCAVAKGVSVVVDYSHGAGGGLASTCDANGGGRSARAIFTGSGFSLQPVQSSPGFVCQVEHRPSAAQCQSVPPANAYWGLFWAKAGSSSWIYSSEGVDSLTIPAGGAVAFAFQDGGGTDYPGQAPSTRSKPTPTPKPSPKPVVKPKPTKTAKPGKGTSAAGTSSSSATASPRAGGVDHRRGDQESFGHSHPDRERLDVLHGLVGRRADIDRQPDPGRCRRAAQDPAGVLGVPGGRRAPLGAGRGRGGAAGGDRRSALVATGLGRRARTGVSMRLAPRPARDLHPGAWWLWAMGLAAGASMTTNPVLLVLIVLVAALTVALRRSDHPWSSSFRLYLVFGAVIVLVRVLFRVLLGGGYGHVVLLDLPTVPLPHWVAGVRLLGPLTLESFLAGLYDGLRLATIVICVGAANALANPKRLLKSMPPALYEIGTAVVVAVALLPQLADSLRRVRAARALRGVPGGRVGRLRGVVVPVMEDALERSMALAAGMDARGYGRSGGLGPAQRRTTGALMLSGLVGICVGTYALLDQTAPQLLVWPGLLGGVVLGRARVLVVRAAGAPQPLPPRPLAPRGGPRGARAASPWPSG